jgi:hypothetical protein
MLKSAPSLEKGENTLSIDGQLYHLPFPDRQSTILKLVL